MAEEYTVITKPVVSLYVTSNINSFGTERRFQKSMTIGELKMKLELLTGSSAANVSLQLLDKNDKSVANVTDDSALLGSFPVEDGMRLHVIDSSHQVGEFEDTSKVEKFELPEDDYAKRNDSARSFLMRNKLGKYAAINPEDEEKKKLAEQEEENKAKSLTVEDRCEVSIPGQMTRRGTVMFVGNVHFKPGWWVGIKYDEPYGKHDGTVDGKRYFECTQKYGSFVKPQFITVGDFPEESLDLDDEM